MIDPTTIKLVDGGKSLTFKIYPFSATKAEDFMIRMVLLTGKNIDLDGGLPSAKDLIKALMSINTVDAKAMLDELLTCVYRVEENSEFQFNFNDADGYISNPLTIIKLRVEAFKASFSFFTDLKEFAFLSKINSTQNAQASAE